MESQLDRIEAKLDELLAKKKRVVKPKGSKSDYSDDFMEAWNTYPKRAGSNPKNKAFAAFEKRISDGLANHEEIYFALFEGLRKYKKYCDATGKTGTEFVMQAATFFGPDKHYENDWTIPKPKADPYAKPEIFSQAFQAADFSGKAEARLDPVDPYADLK